MPDLLAVSPRLAMHTSIVHLHLTNAFRRRKPTIAEYNQGFVCSGPVSMTVSLYTFFHENNRPLGNALPYQCPSCKCLRPWQRTPSRQSAFSESTVTCRGCNHAITYSRPNTSDIILFTEGYQGTSKNGKLVKKGSRGGSGWLVSAEVETGVETNPYTPTIVVDLL